MITVHGRTKKNLKQNTSAANWDVIRRIKEACSIPIIANGGIGSMADVEACLEETKADGVMSSVLILENPTLFLKTQAEKRTPFDIALEYLEICTEVAPECPYRKEHQRYAAAKGHLFKMLYGVLLNHGKQHYNQIGRAQSFEALTKAVQALKAEHDAKCDVEDCGINHGLVYYNRYKDPERDAKSRNVPKMTKEEKRAAKKRRLEEK